MTHDTQTNNAGGTVLLIDDSRVMRKAISRVLVDEFKVLEAEDGEQGWEILSSNDAIDVVISDIEMPRLDGYGLLQRIRDASTDLRSVPVIVITGAEDDATRRVALARGATDFVTKPVDGVQLLARVRTQVQSRVTARTLVATEQTLREESTLDPLTGLSSRRYFLQRGIQDVAYARRRGQDLALFRISIDKFKQVYRHVGDDGIDRLLIWLARVLEDQARTEDTVARIGGADFAVLAPTSGPDAAQTLAMRLLTAISGAQYEQSDRKPLYITVSIGSASLSEDDKLTIQALLDLAERRAKEGRLGGGNTVVSSGHLSTLATPATTGSEPTVETKPAGGAPTMLSDDELAPIDEPEPQLETLETEELNVSLEDLILEEESPMEAETPTEEEGLGLSLDDLTLEDDTETVPTLSSEESPTELVMLTDEEGLGLSLDDLTLEDDTETAPSLSSLEPVALDQAHAGGPAIGGSTPADGLGLDHALDLLAQGDRDALDPHLAQLILRALPLFELGEEKYDLGISVAIAVIRSNLNEANTD